MKVYSNHSTYQEVLNWASSFLDQRGIADHLAKWLMMERFDMTQTDLVINYKHLMPERDFNQYLKDINLAANHYPVQYIVGHEWFYGHKFKVNQDTLIPRPETEEWVDRYLKQLPDRPLNVVDIGTGSGAIGISHKLARPLDSVILTDISEGALKVARENAQKLGAKVEFLQGSTLEPLQKKNRQVDLLISNPPYISKDEWDLMDKSVQEFEPKTALFASNQGLSIYEKLLKESPTVMNDEGCILLEIGFSQSNPVKQLISQVYPQATVETWTDFNGLNRLVKANL